MNWQLFNDTFRRFWCVEINQIRTVFPNFNRDNLRRWQKDGKIIRLRNGVYAFSEIGAKPHAALYAASRIYRPSYISLYSALAFYGLIPEAIVQTTCVTSLKTTSFENELGVFVYRSVRSDLMFGYKPLAVDKNLYISIATPEKALLDLLYLNPQYSSNRELVELRLDDAILHTGFNISVFMEFASRLKSRVIEERCHLFREVYGL